MSGFASLLLWIGTAYFFNHFDTSEFPNFLSQVGANAKPLWVELITSLSNAPFVTIASIHGRTQGGGNELTLAFDLRYASKEKAIFDQPEVAIGLFPGGGGTDMLTRLAGKDRALEAFLSADEYNAELAEKYGWVTRAIPDTQLDGFVEKMANRLASFDKTALITTKRQINGVALPKEADLLNSYAEFTKSLSWPGLQQRMPAFGKMYQEVVDHLRPRARSLQQASLCSLYQSIQRAFCCFRRTPGGPFPQVQRPTCHQYNQE